MTKTDEVIAAILRAIERDLRHHTFSEKHYPVVVEIKTTYTDCVQTLRVGFEKEKERDKLWN